MGLFATAFNAFALFATNGGADSGQRAASEPTAGGLLVQHLVAAIVFSAIGLVVFALALWIIVKVSPFSVRKEIEEDHNTSLAIIVGAIMIGIAIIIAAAIHG